MSATMSRWAAIAALISLAACSSGDGVSDGAGGAGSGAGDAQPAGRAGDRSSKLELTREWGWSAARESAAMPAADGADIALTVSGGRVVMLDDQGKVRWQVDHEVRDVAPAFAGSLLLVPTEQGLLALDRATGRQRWSAPVGDRTNTPAVDGGRAVVTTWEGTLAAIDLADGKVAWRLKLAGNALGPAAAARGTAVATFDTGRAAGAVAVDLATGRQRWSAPLTADGVSAPAIGDGVVVVVAADVAAHGLSLESGAERWRTPLDGSGSPEMAPLPQPDGSVLVAHRLGGMALLDGGDGRVRWDSPRVGAAVRGGPAGPGPNGWFATTLHDGRIVLAGPDHQPDVRTPPSLTSGVAAGPGGVLLVAMAQGKENGLDALSGW